jgi:hypothetical protein
MKFCSKCVLPDTFPGIEFDENGVCNYCRHSQMPDKEKKEEYVKIFEDLLDSVRGKQDFDVLVAYSGGKDSTYTMYQLANKYNLNVLAFTFDNGFISEKARENITRMTDLCGATSLIVRPSFNKMKKIFQIAATKDIYNTKTLDRASSICTTCIGHVKSLVLKTAFEKNIPLVAYGWSPGQAPISSAIMQTSPKFQSISHKTVRDPILENCEELKSYFLSEDDLKIDQKRWPINIHPLAFMDYNEEEILKFIKSVGWEQPTDTDPNSSNCTLNALANYLHRNRFNFHPYAWEIAGIVRAGGIPRNEGLVKTTKEESLPMVKYAADLLEIKI